MKAFFAVVLSASFSSGSVGGAESAATGSGGATASESPLLNSYTQIKDGMTLDQVQAIISSGYSLQVNNGGGRTYALWTQGVYKAPGSTTVQVAFNEAGGADNKYIQRLYADGSYAPQTWATISRFENNPCEQW